MCMRGRGHGAYQGCFQGSTSKLGKWKNGNGISGNFWKVCVQAQNWLQENSARCIRGGLQFETKNSYRQFWLYTHTFQQFPEFHFHISIFR